MVPLVAVANDKFRPGQPSALWDHAIRKPYAVVKIDTMLSTTYETDAHFTCGIVCKGGKPVQQQPRLIKTPMLVGDQWIDPLADLRAHGYDVMFTVVAIDLDMPEHRPLDREHVQIIRDRIRKLATWDMYTTKGGMRLLRRILADPLTAEEYEAYVRVCMVEVRMALTGTDWVIDRNCADWTRHFRCPLVVRDGKRTTSTVRIVDKPVPKPYLAPVKPRPVVVHPREAGRIPQAYLAAATRNACERVRSAPIGSRHTVLYTAAASLAELEMTDREILDTLLPEALAVAREGELAREKKRRCILDGIGRGRSSGKRFEPKALPAPIMTDGPSMVIDEEGT